ncbi:trypsin-like peptidase domain-containing protein [Rhodopirellula sp. MGV]|uniref:trypsin-like peptidase domain-containing protein n=1 Tax=Rhodopirellula sp. MGV TaxID=2023130 RepID=UPI0013040119|nr:trypsin-like peptidase domain-containing protein [Rhodopirellula sp. MGV]
MAAHENAPQVKRQYIQGLIDQGELSAGLAVAEQLLADPAAASEHLEIQGLIGRVHKQRFVNTEDPIWLDESIRSYLPVYQQLPESHLWHGINAAALLHRASGLIETLAYPTADVLGKRILRIIEARDAAGKVNVWDLATGMEASLAVANTEGALQWARRYVASEQTDAFELASTLRQMKEIWQLNKDSEPGNLLLPLLEAELLKRLGGEVLIQDGKFESKKANELARNNQLEKVFGQDSYRTWQWYVTGLERGQAVARIETATAKGVGTGFLVNENEFFGIGSRTLLLTNAHVLDLHGDHGALTPEQAYLKFEASSGPAGIRNRIGEIIATSPPEELDFTIASVTGTLPSVSPFPVSPVTPSPEQSRRLYAIGHPLGGGLSVSLHDNLLIDFAAPFLHYRTPTDPGSSGSPICDSDWELVAIHHAGSSQMQRLHGDGCYEANEGIWIKSIQRFLQGQPPVVVPPVLSETSRAALQSVTRTPLRKSHLSYQPVTTMSDTFNSSLRPQFQRESPVSKFDKQSRLHQYSKQIVSEGRMEDLKTEIPQMVAATESIGFESAGGFGYRQPRPEDAERAIERIQRGESLNEAEMFAMEAIVLPRERPVVFVQNNSFMTPENPWGHYSQSEYKVPLCSAIHSIGRVELPNNRLIPFGGTAFVVGHNLLMTNRHVAELFATGLGNLVHFLTGQTAGWDYLREKGSPEGDQTVLEVRDIRMIHPYWDMALLEVAGLQPSQGPLTLAATPPEGLYGSDVAVIGYPAKDWRNDSELQDSIFKRVYNVKRLQPGKIVAREAINSFGNSVSAMTHDSSTLGGNSGSAVVDARSGKVVGLHFAGIYLHANYCVPSYELARDPRVVDAGVKFDAAAPENAALDKYWAGHEGSQTTRQTYATNSPYRNEPKPSQTGEFTVRFGSTQFSIPFNLSSVSGQESAAVNVSVDPLEATKPPVIFPRLDKRNGYDPGFLGRNVDEVPLPELTDEGKKIVARLDSGDHVLKYHHFSVVMHKIRRLALFTAANVDWRDRMRKINGRKPTRRELNGFGEHDRELWVTDDRIPEAHQLPDVFFTKDGGAFDRGHLVRRDDVTWGKSFESMQKGNGDTFHTTNCSPQVAGFNQSSRGRDNWGDLENMVQRHTGTERVIVMSGPVLDEDDLRFQGRDKRGDVLVQIPGRFWKIIVAEGDDGPEAFGFVLEQDLSNVDLEFTVPANWRCYMKSISEIEELLFGLATLDWLKKHDKFESNRGRRMASRVK